MIPSLHDNTCRRLVREVREGRAREKKARPSNARPGLGSTVEGVTAFLFQRLMVISVPSRTIWNEALRVFSSSAR